MATHLSPSEGSPGVRDEAKPKSLRRSLTRLPVNSRLPKEQAGDESVRNKSTIPTLHHVPPSDIPSSRTTISARSQLKETPSLPRVVQAHPPSGPPSVVGVSNKALPRERQLVYPPPSSTRTPSLVSGSTVSTREGPHSTLRRKASSINQYASRAKTDPESMQEYQHLFGPTKKLQHDVDPFPGAIFGMTLPPASGYRSSTKPTRSSASEQTSSSVKDVAKTTRPTIELGAPFTDAASSRHSDSPFSHQSTPTSASSFSSFAASSLGSARNGDSQDLPRPSEKTQARRDTGQPPTTLRKEAMKPQAISSKEQSQRREPPLERVSVQSSSTSIKSATARDKRISAKNPQITASKMPSGAALVGVPPEFAHLDVPVPKTTSTGKPFPPRRPSRDGIDGLGLTEDIPVVQSNLTPTYMSYIKRTTSHESSDCTAVSPPESPKRTFGFTHRSSSRQSTKSQAGTAYPATPKTPVELYDADISLSRKDSPMVASPIPSKSSRISILPKRSKDQSTNTAKQEKPKRGPAAGTGHEGYGKFGFRGRGSSIFSGGRTSRSSSNDSTSSRRGLPFLSRKRSTTSDTEDDMDQFLDQRKGPVIIRGKGTATGMPTSKDTPGKAVDAPGYRAESTASHGTASEILKTASERVPGPDDHRRPSLSEMVHEGQDGRGQSPTKSPDNPTFLQRVKSKITNQPLVSETPDLEVPTAHSQVKVLTHDALRDRAKPLDLEDIGRLASDDSQSSERSKSPGHEVVERHPPVPYERRHEGFIPAPPALQMRTKTSESPVLLKARTATSAKAPQIVEIPGSPGLTSLQNAPGIRLKSVGRIPQVVRADQGNQKQHITQIASAENTEVENGQRTQSTLRFAEPVAEEGQEFFSFPPRKNSELSYTSSSGLGSPCITRSSFVGEDEVWNEYDTLLDEVMPTKLRASATSSLGAPFQYGDMVERGMGDHSSEPKTPRSTSNPETGKGSQYLDTSRPSTTFTISDYLADNEDLNNKAPSVHCRHSAATSHIDVLAEKRLSKPQDKRKTSYSEDTTKHTPTNNKPRAAVGTPASAELRFAALMTSKWLSFGRLLFSPAHEEAMAGGGSRILIIDGLGKEWSYHCALTYPNCQFYNLGPEPPTPSWETLANHHHLQHSSISAPFPFPRSFFSAIVFRFPIAAIDNAYQACFHEVKRTLRPSGYIELSVLDLDLMNMGSVARKAVRDLKIRIHQADSQISLWNHGDAFLTLLGKRGFENIQRCVVGIPVAGRIRRSQDSGSSTSSAGLYRRRTRSETEPEYLRFTEWMQAKGSDNDDRDEHNERRNDEDITKTVARIGRWWYSSCYPDPGTTADHVGIWDTPGLLRECERQRTSFRLLFCYAQKPVCVKRRTASV